MKEQPILFNGAKVRALLDGSLDASKPLGLGRGIPEAAMSNCCNGIGAGEQCQHCTHELAFPPLDLPAPKYCECSKQHCTTPWTCNPVCRLIKSDGSQRVSDSLPVQIFKPRRWYQRPPSLYSFAVVGALIGFCFGCTAFF